MKKGSCILCIQTVASLSGDNRNSIVCGKLYVVIDDHHVSSSLVKVRELGEKRENPLWFDMRGFKVTDYPASYELQFVMLKEIKE